MDTELSISFFLKFSCLCCVQRNAVQRFVVASTKKPYIVDLNVNLEASY